MRKFFSSLESEQLNQPTAVVLRDYDVDQQALENDITGSVLESIGLYALEMEQLVRSGQCTAVTNAMVIMGVQQQLNRLGMVLEGVALESANDAQHQGQLVLEGLRDAWNRIKQGFLLAIIKDQENWDDLRRARQVLGDNLGKLKAAEDDYKEKHFTESEHTGNMVELWQFFTTRKERRTDLAAAVREDTPLTAYVFGTYLPKVSEQLSQLAGILEKAKFDTPQAAAATAAQVEKLKHPLELFEDKWAHKADGYLNAVALEIKEGTARNTLTVAGKQFPRLAKLATPGYVNASSSVGHTMKEIFYSGNVAQTVTSDSFKYSTKDIGELIKAGEGYAKGFEPIFKVEETYMAASKRIAAALKRLKDVEMARESQLVLTQMSQYYDNLSKAAFSLGWRERIRSMMGLRYCAYAADRMVVNAK